MTSELKKLIVRIERKPFNLYTLTEGNTRINSTLKYEHGWATANDFMWIVPNGTYLVEQMGRPTTYVVSDKGIEILTDKKDQKEAVPKIEKGVTLKQVLEDQRKPKKSK